MREDRPLLGAKEAEARYKRFRCALVLAGKYAIQKLAADLKVRPENLNHIMRQTREKGGKVKRSWRVETYLEKWTYEQLKKGAAIINPPESAPAVSGNGEGAEG